MENVTLSDEKIKFVYYAQLYFNMYINAQLYFNN